MMAFTVLMIYVASIIACHYIAKRRGIEPVYWGFIAFLIGPLAVPLVLLARPIR